MFVVDAYELSAGLSWLPYYDRFVSDRRDRSAALLSDPPLRDESLTGPEYETELIGGPAAEAIAKVVRVRQADQIVVGARGLRRSRALLGSVSHELLHIADRPVVVIPAACSDPRHDGRTPRMGVVYPTVKRRRPRDDPRGQAGDSLSVACVVSTIPAR